MSVSKVTEEWIEIRREAIQRQGFAVRAAPAPSNAIELKGGRWKTDRDEWVGPIDDTWRRIELMPGQYGVTEFETPEIRDEVLRRLIERK